MTHGACPQRRHTMLIYTSFYARTMAGGWPLYSRIYGVHRVAVVGLAFRSGVCPPTLPPPPLRGGEGGGDVLQRPNE